MLRQQKLALQLGKQISWWHSFLGPGLRAEWSPQSSPSSHQCPLGKSLDWLTSSMGAEGKCLFPKNLQNHPHWGLSAILLGSRKIRHFSQSQMLFSEQISLRRTEYDWRVGTESQRQWCFCVVVQESDVRIWEFLWPLKQNDHRRVYMETIPCTGSSTQRGRLFVSKLALWTSVHFRSLSLKDPRSLQK